MAAARGHQQDLSNERIKLGRRRAAWSSWWRNDRRRRRAGACAQRPLRARGRKISAVSPLVSYRVRLLPEHRAGRALQRDGSSCVAGGLERDDPPNDGKHRRHAAGLHHPCVADSLFGLAKHRNPLSVGASRARVDRKAEGNRRRSPTRARRHRRSIRRGARQAGRRRKDRAGDRLEAARVVQQYLLLQPHGAVSDHLGLPGQQVPQSIDPPG